MYSTYTSPSAPTIDRSLAGARDRSRARVRARHSSSHRARDDDAFVSDDAKRALRLAAVVVIDDVARGAREPPSAAPNAARGGGERERERERRRMGLARTRVCGYVRVEGCCAMRAMCVCGVRDLCDSRGVAMRIVSGDRDRSLLPYPSARGLFVAVNRAVDRAVDRARARVMVMETVSIALSMSRTRWVIDD